MSKETKNGLKAVGIGWLSLGLLFGTIFLVMAFPLIGMIVMFTILVLLLSLILFLGGSQL